MADRYEDAITRAIMAMMFASGLPEVAAAYDFTEAIKGLAAALRENDRERAILEARVTMLNEAHRELNGALRSASIIAEREGRDTNWAGFRETIRYSLEMSHLVINTIPAPPPDTGRGQG